GEGSPPSGDISRFQHLSMFHCRREDAVAHLSTCSFGDTAGGSSIYFQKHPKAPAGREHKKEDWERADRLVVVL
ncbi:MAG TPA: hypothetical protein VKC60_02515, partial [Opitutaceae bacterium]|nr:hypothetical protein [Opitutaceae bacterium]